MLRVLRDESQQYVSVWPVYDVPPPPPTPVRQRPHVDPHWVLDQLVGWMTVQELARKTGVDPTTVSQQIYRAYKRGELERQPVIGFRHRGRFGHRYRRKA